MTQTMQQSQPVPDIWIIRVGLMTALVLFSMTLILGWLVLIARWKNNAEYHEDNSFENVVQQSSVNPIALHTITDSVRWKGAGKNNNVKSPPNTTMKTSSSSSVTPSNKVLNTSTRGKFAILGEDDEDEDEEGAGAGGMSGDSKHDSSRLDSDKNDATDQDDKGYSSNKSNGLHDKDESK
jgi:hypothetical protein